MSGQADFDEDASRRTYTAPYTGKNQVPTVQGYEAEKQQRQEQEHDRQRRHERQEIQEQQEQEQYHQRKDVDSQRRESQSLLDTPSPKSSKRKSFMSSAKSLLGRQDSSRRSRGGKINPYEVGNRNIEREPERAGLADNDPSSPTSTSTSVHQYTPSKRDGPGPSGTNLPFGHNGSVISKKDSLENSTENSIEKSRDPSSPTTPTTPTAATSQGQSHASRNNHETRSRDPGSSQSPITSTSPSQHPRNPNPAQQTDDAHIEDTSETHDATASARQKRKNIKHMVRDDTDRQVTDPITHLPVAIHDSTSQHLAAVPENEPHPGLDARTTSGRLGRRKSDSQLNQEQKEQDAGHRAMQRLFPPPAYEAARTELGQIYRLALIVGLSVTLAVPLCLLLVAHVLAALRADGASQASLLIGFIILASSGLTVGGCTIMGLGGWLRKRVHDVWDDQVWEAARQQHLSDVKDETPESVQWLNSLLSSVWAIVNPDLFAALVDTLEDVMQASLPKLVRMVSVEDLGQGSEAIRILGVRWLPTGAAAQAITDLEPRPDQASAPPADSRDTSPHADSQNASEQDGKSQQEKAVDSGMEAEEGDFVNMEVAFSYRASKTGKSLSEKTKNAHLFLGFYLPGNIKFPVWVELRGIVGTMRMRLQLCPDPPFFALCTLTLLGQPKADLSCVPLTKHGLNIMNLPLISSFVQSSIDAALAEYVAPRSLTIDLQDMLIGDDFKKDTISHGVLAVHIKRGRDFKAGDPGIRGIRSGSSDAYVAVGWAKFGKPVWTTRVILDEMQPVWDETAFVLVGPDEVNADERLRVQLWDSDRISADDDLGRIELDLKDLMTKSEFQCRMQDRFDGFRTLEGDGEMPGRLEWSVGYYPKTRIQSAQFAKQSVCAEISNLHQLKEKVAGDAERKLREAKDKNEACEELAQQKAQDLKSKEDAMIISAPPLDSHPSGILSVEIHNITGLELERVNKRHGQDEDGDDRGVGDDLPSAYCTIILNHQIVYKTRTKPKNAQPFYAAGTERMLRDWRMAEVIVAVWDSRVHENDALLGLVYLPLAQIFSQRAQIVDSFPLVGGIGYGRARISLVFRSVELHLPRKSLGWDYGTVDIVGAASTLDLAPELRGLRIKLHTYVNRAKMYPKASTDNDAPLATEWSGKKGRVVRLAVRRRYSCCMTLEFRQDALGLNKTVAFGMLWFKDLIDDEDQDVEIPVWRADKDLIKRGTTNCMIDHGELGERMGTLRLPVRFRPGLSRHHERLTSKNEKLQSVMLVISTAQDHQEQRHVSHSDESESDDESNKSSLDDAHGGEKNNRSKRVYEDDKSNSAQGTVNGLLHKIGLVNHDDNNDDDDDDDDDKHTKTTAKNDIGDNPLAQAQDYRKHSGQLHRRHRGIMQLKEARTALWMKTKVEHGKNHVRDTFGHGDRDPDVETEV